MWSAGAYFLQCVDVGWCWMRALSLKRRPKMNERSPSSYCLFCCCCSFAARHYACLLAPLDVSAADGRSRVECMFVDDNRKSRALNSAPRLSKDSMCSCISTDYITWSTETQSNYTRSLDYNVDHNGVRTMLVFMNTPWSIDS